MTTDIKAPVPWGRSLLLGILATIGLACCTPIWMLAQMGRRLTILLLRTRRRGLRALYWFDCAGSQTGIVRSQRMKNSDLPARWNDRIERWVRTRTDDKRNKLGASDFPAAKVADLQFPDGSTAQFRFAVVIEAPEIGEVGVFTEHCGYHIFPLVDTTLRMQDIP